MSIYDKAKALADEIQNCDELRRVKESELKMLIDMEARQIVETYQQIQMDAINAGIAYDDLDDAKRLNSPSSKTRCRKTPSSWNT